MKTVFILFACLSIACDISAQAKKVELGVVGAPSYIQMYGNDYTKLNDHGYIGFAAGISCQYNITKVVSIRADVLFERKGFARAYNTAPWGTPHVDSSVGYHVDYVVIPVLARVTKRWRHVELYVNAGPYIGIYLQQSRDIPEPYLSQDRTMQPVDVGVSTGVGFNIPIRQRFIFSMEFRGNVGLLNISTVRLPDHGTIKTNSLNLFAGFAYRIGRGAY